MRTDTIRAFSRYLFYSAVFALAALLIFWVFVSQSILHNQIRNYFGRASAEIRQIHTALESYHLDYGTSPIQTEANPYGLERLTTPVAYLPTLPSDPFALAEDIEIHEKPPKTAMYYIYIGFWVFLLVTLVCAIAMIRRCYARTIINIVLLIAGVLGTFDVCFHYALFDLYDKYAAWRDPYLLFRGVGLKYPEDMDGDVYLNTTYLYGLTKDNCAVVASPGPDLVLELDARQIRGLSGSELSEKMISYWPTNGIRSKGDIWVLVR
ncbi:MAG: hypothetical protein ABIH23_21210 [bacterium]